MRAMNVAPLALCVVIPVLNERDNVAPLVARLDATLAGIGWEAIFVDDDSTDGTRDAVRAVAAGDPRVRLLHRIGRRGLSSAFIEGAQASLAPCIAAIDGDMQHDETLLPLMLAALTRDDAELAIGSRYVAGGGVGDWDATRAGLSTLATRISQLLLKVPLSDPMSGFFMIRRDSFTETMRSLSGQGFKILLDLFASAPRPLAFAEVPFTFRQRLHGESKLDAMVAWEYLMLLLEKLVGPAVPVRFLLFALIGALGVGTHLFTLWFATHVLFVGFALAQSVATIFAMTGKRFLPTKTIPDQLSNCQSRSCESVTFASRVCTPA